MIAKKTLMEQTREYILNYIREQRLEPGDKLPAQREISRILNVSPKIPEIVLNELEAEHIVVRKSGRGTFLAAPDLNCENIAVSRNVFLLLPTLRNSYFADCAAGAEVALLARKKNLQIITQEAYPDVRDITQRIVEAGTVGIIAHFCPAELRNFANRHKVPLVEFRDRKMQGRVPNVCKYVISDVRAAALMQAKHLLDLGHRDIYLAGDLTGENYEYRFRILKEFLEENGCKVRHMPQLHPIRHYPSYEAIGVELAQRMLQEGLPATAGIFFNTSRAVGAMRYLRQNGVRVPEDFSITGFDRPLQTGFPEPVITASYHNRETELAVSLLFSGRESAQIVTIDPVLEPGSSTAPARNKAECEK